MQKLLNKYLLTVILVIYVALMIFGAIYPHPENIPGLGGNTKYFHFLGFILLMILVLKTFEIYRFKHRYILSVIFVAFFIYLTEFLQLFVSTRHFLYTDMLIDVAGAAIGGGLYKWILYKVSF